MNCFVIEQVSVLKHNIKAALFHFVRTILQTVFCEGCNI